MPTTVDIPNVGEVEFPDDMAPADIEREAAKLHIQANPPASNKQPVIDMEQSVLGNLQAGPTGSGPDQNLPSPKGQMAKDTQPSPAVGAVTLAGAAGTVAAPVVDAALASPAGKEAIKFALKHALEGAGLGATYAAIKHLLK